MALSFSLNDAERDYLSRVARLAIESALAGRDAARPPEPPASAGAAAAGPDTLRRALGSFVTLTLDGRLRGCIGTIVGREPLFLNVWRMARAAAFEDPRFPPLTVREWPETASHISVLDELTPCPDPQAIEVGRTARSCPAIHGAQRRFSAAGARGTGLGSRDLPGTALRQGGPARRQLARARRAAVLV